MFWVLPLINGYCFGIWVKNFTQSLSFMTLETKPGCNVDQTFPSCHSEPDQWIARGKNDGGKMKRKKKTGSETRTSEAAPPPLYLRWFENQREFQQLPSCRGDAGRSTGMEAEKNQVILICSARQRRRAHYSAPTRDTLLPVLQLAH